MNGIEKFINNCQWFTIGSYGNDMQVQHELNLYEHLLVFWVV